MHDSAEIRADAAPRAVFEKRLVTPAETPAPVARVRFPDEAHVETSKRRLRESAPEAVENDVRTGEALLPHVSHPAFTTPPAIVPAAPLATDHPSAAAAAPAPVALRSLIESRIVEKLTPELVRTTGTTTPRIAATAVRQQSESSAPPRVEIHIGRIEITPASAPIAETRHADTSLQPRPPQSLDAYLAQRRRT
ncbi:hypothetical protein [Paraburkholderia dipogonis]|jgi:hypothetical protein|uniref:hypothetical protein n=1 Tax=Paraburkholderia dipogonis TaxID=1211383 RepID=UPI0038BB5D65